jgi:hypothetical protein
MKVQSSFKYRFMIKRHEKCFEGTMPLGMFIFMFHFVARCQRKLFFVLFLYDEIFSLINFTIIE